MLPLIVAMILTLAAVALIGFFISRNIIRVPPDEAVILSGAKRNIVDPETGERRAIGYRIIVGGSAFQIPVLERADHLPLAEMSIQSDLENLIDINGRTATVSILVNCRISPDGPEMSRAITRFLTMDLTDIEQIVKTTIESRIINSLPTIDASDTAGWPQQAAKLEQAVREDLAALGVEVDNLIFRGPPKVSATPATVNGHAAFQDG